MRSVSSRRTRSSPTTPPSSPISARAARCSTARSRSAPRARRRSPRCRRRCGRSSRPAPDPKLTASTTTAFARLDPQAARRSRPRPARRADHPGRGAHLRARRALLGREDLLAVRADVGARRRRAAALVPRGAHRTGARGGDQRGRLDGVVHRRRHGLRHVAPAARAVLHLLFDVRVPAGGRPDLVVRRPAGEGLPPRRDRRAHHADRRGTPALRRAEPAARERGAELPDATTRRSPTRSR